VITGKATISNRINTLSCYLAKFILDAAHGFDMHDPVTAKWHLNQSFYILSAPVINQPKGILILTDTFTADKFFLYIAAEFLL
jgi:hypothetical protein